jgi:predicted enzyme related to lactoylglutathione lyase
MEGRGGDGLLRAVDAVTIPVPDLERGLRFYRDALGHRLLWRDDDRGQVGLALPEGGGELVLALRQRLEPDWLVESVPDAVAAVVAGGGSVLSPVEELPVGRLAVVADPFGNPLVLVDLSKGRRPAPPTDGPAAAPR